MVNRSRLPFFFLLLSIAGNAVAMAPRPVQPPVPMELIRAEVEPEAKAIAIEWVVPNVKAVGPLDRLELLVINTKGDAIFGAMQNLADRCDPTPPGSFGVVLDPTSDDRSIKNVASAGIQGQWDQKGSGGTLLKQSVSGIHGGNLGIAFWIAPKDWKPDTYLIAVRAIRKKSRPEPWRNLATVDVAGAGAAVTADLCLVKPLFMDAGRGGPLPTGTIQTVTLIRYERQPQDEGVVMKRWAGDTSGETKTVEIERRAIKLNDLSNGLIPLAPGLYQFKHSSVSGRPPSGTYGESDFFEIKPGQKTPEIPVRLFMAI